MFGKDKDKTQHVKNMYIQQLEENTFGNFLIPHSHVSSSDKQPHVFDSRLRTVFTNMASHITEQLHSV